MKKKNIFSTLQTKRTIVVLGPSIPPPPPPQKKVYNTQFNIQFKPYIVHSVLQKSVINYHVEVRYVQKSKQ